MGVLDWIEEEEETESVVVVEEKREGERESKRNTIHNQRSPRNYLVRREQKKW